MDTSTLASTRIVGTHEGTGRARVTYIFIQPGGDEYHVIRIYGYSLTSLFIS